MKKKLYFTCALGIIILNSCQQEDSLNVVQESDVKNEAIQFELVSDEVVTSEESDMTLRSSALSGYETSIPIYDYYFHCVPEEKSDHYHGKEVPTGSTLKINGYNYTYYSGQQNFNLESQKSSLAVPLYRHYNAALNNHLLSTYNSVYGYTLEGILGYIFPSPQLGTVPLKEYYSAKHQNNYYIARKYDEWYLQNNEPNYIYRRTMGYVYAGERIDSHKTASTIEIGKIQAIPTHINMKINARYGTQNRVITYQAYIADYTNSSAGGYASLTLDPTLSISSIDLTIITVYEGRSYTNTFHLTAANNTYTAQVKTGMTLTLRAHTTEIGSNTHYSLSYKF